MKKICVINTGGTIGMRKTEQGLKPEKGFLELQLSQMHELTQPSMPELGIVEYDPIIDSSNMQPSDWFKLAKDIEQRYTEFDGFVVLHGTDTMAYSSSALPFIFGPVGKPIIFTGSQLPLAQIRSDGRENLKTAIVLAAEYDVPEISLLFGDLLLRGCRATKTSAASFDAFESPNFDPLGRIGATIRIDRENLSPAIAPEIEVQAKPIRSHEMATFRLFPGMSAAVLENVLMRPLKALLIESYGIGNGPSTNAGFLRTLRQAADDGIVLVSVSQCKNAFVTQSEYETGRALQEAGVVSGCDMTLEAAIAKLHYLFSNYESTEEIKKLVSVNLVGELTEIN